jgi:hypothetical protein
MQLWKFLVISIFGLFYKKKQGISDRMLFFKYFSQNGEKLPPKIKSMFWMFMSE